MSELFQNQNVTIVGDDVPVLGLAYDSRAVSPGYLFAALRGVSTDGHDHFDHALSNGATSLLSECPVETSQATVVQCSNTRLALALAARTYYGDPAAHLATVGITGTNGKTTTAHLVEGILEQAGLVPGIIGTLGARYQATLVDTGLTTPQSSDLCSILEAMRADGCQSVVMETSSHALAQHRVSGVSFDVAVFTNLGHDHLDYHASLEDYFEAKAILPKTLMKPTGITVLNLDDSQVSRLYSEACLGFSRRGDARARVQLKEHHITASGAELTVSIDGESAAFRTSLIGGFNIENVLAAISVGVALGLDHRVIGLGLEAVPAIAGRLERVSRDGEPLVVVDYAHTPDALTHVLGAVGEVVKGDLICVFGCGGDRDSSKRAPMGEAVAAAATAAILTNDNPRTEDPNQIAKSVVVGLEQGGLVAQDTVAGGAYTVELDRTKAIALAVAAAGPGDAVLIAGKGHEDYQIIGTERCHFDDRECARESLDALASE